MTDHRLFVSDDGNTLVRLYDNGRAEVAHRDPETRRWDLEVPLTEEAA